MREINMDKNLKWVNEKKIERTIKSLENNNMHGYFVNSNEELIQKITDLVNKDSLVACGGSQTLFETGVIDHLRSGRYKFLDRYEKDLTPKDLKDMHRKAFLSDAYFTSSNAITENGELYNVDGNGNRIAAMLYGPEKVIVVCGVNKIVKDINDAIKRNELIAAQANAKRLDTKTPCKTTGYCMDCNSVDRICCEYTVIKRQRTQNRIHVILLNENFGY
jgi:L-lactate utilization protein LutB